MDRLPGIRPRPSLWRQLDSLARRCFPTAATGLLLAVLAAPLGLPGQAELQQAAALACIFFWSMFRPASMTPPMVFVLGLLVDLLGCAPPGVAVLVLLIAHGLALRWRRVLTRQGFLLVWLAYLGVAAGSAVLSWALVSLLTFTFLPLGPVVLQAGLSAGCYPLLATILIRAHRSLADPDQA
jgi:rod shape-determining protein MreD